MVVAAETAVPVLAYSKDAVQRREGGLARLPLRVRSPQGGVPQLKGGLGAARSELAISKAKVKAAARPAKKKTWYGGGDFGITTGPPVRPGPAVFILRQAPSASPGYPHHAVLVGVLEIEITLVGMMHGIARAARDVLAGEADHVPALFIA